MRLSDKIKKAFANFQRPAFRLPRREEGELTLSICAGYTRQELGKALRELGDEFIKDRTDDVGGFVLGGRWTIGEEEQ